MQHVLGVGQQKIAGAFSAADQDVGHRPAVQPFDDQMQGTVLEKFTAARYPREPGKRILYVLDDPPAI